MERFLYKETEPFVWGLFGQEAVSATRFKSVVVDGEVYGREYQTEAIATVRDDKIEFIGKDGVKTTRHYPYEKLNLSFAPFVSVGFSRYIGKYFNFHDIKMSPLSGESIFIQGSENDYAALYLTLGKIYGVEMCAGHYPYENRTPKDISFWYESGRYGGGYSLFIKFSIYDILNMDVKKWDFEDWQLSRLRHRLEEISWLPKRIFKVFKEPLDDQQKMKLAEQTVCNYSKHLKTKRYETC